MSDNDTTNGVGGEAADDRDLAALGASYSDQRQRERLAEICKREGWPARLPFDLAMQLEPAEETFARYGMVVADGVKLLENQKFLAVLKTMREAIVGEGVSFRQKAKLAAEELLTYAYEIATDPQASDSVRADLIKWHAKVAGLEPTKEQGGEGGGGGPSFQLSVIFAGERDRPRVIEGNVQRVTDADVIEATKTIPMPAAPVKMGGEPT